MSDRKEYYKEYYQKNKEAKLEYCKQYYWKNKEARLKYSKQRHLIHPEYNKQYYQEHKESEIEYSKKYRREHKEAISERDRIYTQEHKKELAEYNKKWHKTEEGKSSRQRRKVKRKAREKEIINTLTSDEWINILKEHKFRCAYCGKEFTLFDRETRDHIIPISKGGDNIKENIVPACKSCNSKKHNKILTKKED